MNQEKLKQRLIELLDSVGHDYDEYVDSCHEDGMSPYESFEEFAAPYLIANGVTIRERGEWISVTDRLPEKNRYAVLIALRWEETDIGWYDKDDKCWQSDFVNSYEDGEITHWMPLPEPPERSDAE